MEEYTQITLGQWMSWKEDIRQKLAETADNFVHIGYRLKQIRDSGIYDGAADIFEFAEKEYGLGKSTVSRFIAINERYSEGGNSLELKKEFKGFSSSKLAEMLTLPDSELALVTDRTTVKDIRELKSFNRQQAEDIVLEGSGEDGSFLTAFQKCIIEYFRDKKELLNDVMDAVYRDEDKKASDLINPSGYGTYNKGLIYLFLYDYTQGVKYKQFGRDEITQMNWHEFLMEIYDIFGTIYEAGEEDIHGAYYGRKPDPVATSQQAEKPEDTIAEQEAVDREDREDIDADNEHPVADESCDAQDGTDAGTREADTEDGAGHEGSKATPVQPEEQIEGQMDITDFPEYIPEKVSDMEGQDKEVIMEPLVSQDGLERHIENQSEIITGALKTMNMLCAEKDWDGLIKKAEDIIVRVESIKRIEEVYRQ